MPSPVTQNKSPFSKLFNQKPNYLSLKTFGCLCYPWLRPYTSNKLEPRSRPCVFVGYSIPHHAYMCLDPISNKIFTSRHVIFIENSFPFQNENCTHEPLSNMSSIGTWLHESIGDNPQSSSPTVVNNINPNPSLVFLRQPQSPNQPSTSTPPTHTLSSSFSPNSNLLSTSVPTNTISSDKDLSYSTSSTLGSHTTEASDSTPVSSSTIASSHSPVIPTPTLTIPD